MRRRYRSRSRSRRFGNSSRISESIAHSLIARLRQRISPARGIRSNQRGNSTSTLARAPGWRKALNISGTWSIGDDIGDHRLRFDTAAGEGLDGLVEIDGIVAEDEIEADFLHDADDRHELIGLHTDTDDDHLAARPDHLDGVGQGAFDADAFEDQFGTVAGDLADLDDRVGLPWD